jgi:hypothetical protein
MSLRRPPRAVSSGAIALLLAFAGCAAHRTVAPAPAVTRPAPVRADPASLPPAAFDVAETPWWFGADPGRRLDTRHYRIHTTISHERVLARLPIFMECALRNYTSVLGDLPEPSAPLESYIFRERGQWRSKTREILPEQASAFENLGRGGFTTRGTSVLYYLDWGGRDHDTLAIAAHEGWHQYTQVAFRNALPIWLEEGIATYMEGYSFPLSDRFPEFRPAQNNERQSALAVAIRRDRLIPLRELLDAPPQSFLEDGKRSLLTYYAQAWALTRFLAEGAEGRYRPALERALIDAAEGRLTARIARAPAVVAAGGRPAAIATRGGPWLILAYFESDMHRFEQEYLAFLRHLAR